MLDLREVAPDEAMAHTMSTGPRLPLSVAETVALRIVSSLKPWCERIEVAGSIRRKCPDVGDIEIVCVPKMVEAAPASMFEPPEKVCAVNVEIDYLLSSGLLAPHPVDPKNGQRYKKLWIPHAEIQLDLFIVRPPAEWGPILTIRTGPAAYSQALVTGLHPRGLRCEGGRVLDRNDDLVTCPEERDFLRVCGVPWTEPEARA